MKGLTLRRRGIIPVLHIYIYILVVYLSIGRHLGFVHLECWALDFLLKISFWGSCNYLFGINY